jgi:hypothetical protein
MSPTLIALVTSVVIAIAAVASSMVILRYCQVMDIGFATIVPSMVDPSLVDPLVTPSVTPLAA